MLVMVLIRAYTSCDIYTHVPVRVNTRARKDIMHM